MQLDVSPAEVLDRWSILDLKKANISNPDAQASLQRQLDHLAQIWHDAELPAKESLAPFQTLQEVNRKLWDTEDALRAHEARGDFDVAFIALARSVYQLNDARSTAKRAINELLAAAQDEWKSYGG